MSSERRLLRDIKELRANPLLHVVACPLETNIFEWHGNLTGTAAPFDSVAFHFILKFPEDYPVSAPSLTLSTSIPHRNVFSNATAGGYKLCLDMLQNDAFISEGHLNRPYAGWTSAYSVHSVLLQLQAFLFDPDFLSTTASNRPSLNTCIGDAKKFKCSCGHSGEKITTSHPAFPTEEDLSRAGQEKIEITRPSLLLGRLSGVPDETSADPQKAKPTVSTTTTTTTQASTAPSVSKPSEGKSKAKNSVYTLSKPIVAKVDDTDTWCEWKGRVARVSKSPVGSVKYTKTQDFDGRSHSIYDHLVGLPNDSVYTLPVKTAPSKGSQAANKLPAQVYAATKQSSVQKKPFNHIASKPQHNNKPQQQTQAVSTLGFVQLQIQAQTTTSFKKENLWNLVLNENKNNHQKTSNASNAPAKKAQTVTQPLVALQPKDSTKPVWPAMQNKTTTKPSPSSTSSNPSSKPVVAKGVQGTKKTVKKSPETDAPFVFQDGCILSLPFEIIHAIIMAIDLQDVRSVTLVCKQLNRAVEDGFLWKQLFSKYYPVSQFTAKNLTDWKYLFQMEVGRIFETLKCYHTKLSFTEDVLGLPLQITINPRLDEIDYIHPDMDLISSQAYLKEKIRQTVWKENFTHWLPIYVDRDHFIRSLPLLERSMVQLSPHWKTQKFSPFMVSEVIPKMMNTMVVLLSDKGIHASEKALSVYCSLHRLFIALVKQFPGLQRDIDQTVMGFCCDPEKRHKNATPNLGHLLPLLSVSSVPWRKVLPYIIMEQFDRGFIWVAKKYPGLANVNDKGAKSIDNDRLTKTFEASTISLRITMFHVQFLRRFRKVADLDAIAADYDRYYGFPSFKDLSGFQRSVAHILKVSNWSTFYALCEMKAPTPAELTKTLVSAVRNSRKKKYHNDRTDFSRIHASGVSKILLKGESYTCNTNLNTVKLEEIWKFPEGKTQFLDASCLVYHFDSSKIEHVDYRCLTDSSGAIVHSGDMMDHEKSQGKHVIQVSLKKLPRTVCALYFTISAWHTTLKDILHPEILFVDPESNQQLCSYQFGDNKNTGSLTAVIMAKMVRKTADSQWEVVAVGHLGSGMAGQYGSIEQDIKKKNL